MSHPLNLTLRLPRSRTDSLEDAYRQQREPVLRYLYRLCGDRDYAEDLMQETFARAWANRHSVRDERALPAWLFRIARNLYLNSTRRPDPRRISTDELLNLPDQAHAGDPMSQVVAGEQRDRIQRTLAELSEKHRSILLLRDAEDLPYADIALVLDISVAAVKVNLFRARNAFRQIYTPLEGADDV